jgi:hypothetical protein
LIAGKLLPNSRKEEGHTKIISLNYFCRQGKSKKANKTEKSDKKMRTTPAVLLVAHPSKIPRFSDPGFAADHVERRG